MTNDNHGAAKSGTKREKKLSKLFSDLGYPYVKKEKECRSIGISYDDHIRITPNEEYLEDGFKYFLVDGFCPRLSSYIELKGGDKSGTTEEKVFFDLEKICDGIYGKYRLLYIFEGKKEDDKCTRLFIRKLQKLQEEGNEYAQRVTILKYSDITQELLDSLA